VSHDVDLALCYEHVFDIRINFHTRLLFGPVSGGAEQGYTSVGEGCTVAGPRLNGQLLDYGGGDWPVIRTDGVVELNAHYVIVADDGTQIYIRNLGYLRIPRPAANDPVGKPPVATYFRCTPYFRAPQGPHDWLNRTVIVGVGQRKPKIEPNDAPDHSLFRYYAIL
jgi:hypothetical protein